MGSKHDNLRNKGNGEIIKLFIFLFLIFSENSKSTEVYVCKGIGNNYECYPLPETYNSQNEITTFEPQEKELTEYSLENYDYDM